MYLWQSPPTQPHTASATATMYLTDAVYVAMYAYHPHSCVWSHVCTYLIPSLRYVHTWLQTQEYIYIYIGVYISHSTENATPFKSTRSRHSDSSVSRTAHSNWDFGLSWICTGKCEFLDLVDFGGVAFSVECVILVCGSGVFMYTMCIWYTVCVYVIHMCGMTHQYHHCNTHCNTLCNTLCNTYTRTHTHTVSYMYVDLPYSCKVCVYVIQCMLSCVRCAFVHMTTYTHSVHVCTGIYIHVVVGSLPCSFIPCVFIYSICVHLFYVCSFILCVFIYSMCGQMKSSCMCMCYTVCVGMCTMRTVHVTTYTQSTHVGTCTYLYEIGRASCRERV